MKKTITHISELAKNMSSTKKQNRPLFKLLFKLVLTLPKFFQYFKTVNIIKDGNNITLSNIYAKKINYKKKQLIKY